MENFRLVQDEMLALEISKGGDCVEEFFVVAIL